MKILVDADACPVKELIVSCAKQFELPVIMIVDTSHELKDDYSMVITVDQDRDSVDFALMKRLDREDIVVTQDHGLAALVLGKGARAINQNGLVYTDSNIERLLFERHVGQKVRRGGGRTTNVKKRTKENNEWFRTAFIRLIEETKDRTFE
ncbi:MULTISPECIES: YaiI/YqxD family protein [Dehalobacter]|jgi:hypothetical protein|uniref:YaiI/YqxD family protein n=1 Tax=Dehalobacter TaxID=56112 RepID=UPI0003153CF5|nr:MULTISPECIES: YaiI/YqxD family protein [Dehalobacter]MCG1026037.1 YaiI/YqxD family protein [Dehalobacter sp.]MDJ0304778.1 YaiI/YqxD family protein [Dehalobacter sp.]OCZ50453.1 hypothetical protein A7D23_14710 [Dehalobacter sp. TeCB1]